MAYSQASLCNLALNRIGARGQITDINENSPNAVKCLTVWDAIFQEVLSERDWRFAKIRTSLQLAPTPPLYAYKYAWALPGDLLRFVRPHKRPPNQSYAWFWGPEGEGWYNRQDPPFWPYGYPYVIETLPSVITFSGTIVGTVLTATGVTNGTLGIGYPIYGEGVAAGTVITALDLDGPGMFIVNNSQSVATENMTSAPGTTEPTGKYALCDYAGDCGPAKINYIRLITDYSQIMPGFANALVFRLAQELAIPITEDLRKYEAMESLYRNALNSAEAQNECLDFSEDESGSSSWVDAGRCIRWF